MSHSLTKIWIHALFRTKNSDPLITQNLEPKLYTYITKILEDELNCQIRIINGIQNHIHILFLLNANHSLKDIIHRIKGSSSH